MGAPTAASAGGGLSSYPEAELGLQDSDWNLTGTRGRLRQLSSDFLGWTFAMTQPAQTQFGHIIWFRLEVNANVLRLLGLEV